MRQPFSSPWGEILTSNELCKGVFEVSTINYGGIMIHGSAAAFLSDEAKKWAVQHGVFLCFGNGADVHVALREILDKGLWLPSLVADDLAVYEEIINDSLRTWNPGYWQWREDWIAKLAADELILQGHVLLDEGGDAAWPS